MTDCIEYKGSSDSFGYGRVWSPTKKRHEKAHRISYCESKGIDLSEIAGLVVRHTCDNPPCINPNHLILGTHKDNSQDMVSRGRNKFFKGEDHTLAKLTNKDVDSIRERYKPRCRTNGCRAMAREYGVCHKTIHEVIHNKRWRV